MRGLQILLLLIMLGALFIFALQNPAPIDVKFLQWQQRTSIPLLMVGTYLLGMLSGWAVVGFIARTIRRAGERPRD